MDTVTLIEVGSSLVRLLPEPSRLHIENEDGQAEVPLTADQAEALDRAHAPGGGAATEIERRFLLGALPPLDPSWGQRLRQGYIVVDRDVAFRIRDKGNGHKITIKRGRGLARSELELDVDDAQAKLLWPLAGDRIIDKTRYRVPDGDGVLELDLYHGRHDGLRLVEREFSSLEEARAWPPPEWAGREITEDGRYTNAQLALGQLPGKDLTS